MQPTINNNLLFQADELLTANTRQSHMAVSGAAAMITIGACLDEYEGWESQAHENAVDHAMGN